MTNDELLAKLLDNSLTESEQQELSVRMAASPQLAEEVREFLAVEDLLHKTKPTLQTTIPSHLMDSVEHAVAASVVAGGSTTTATTGTATLLPLSPRLLGGLSILLVSAGVLWYLLPGGDNKPATPANPTTAVYEQPTGDVQSAPALSHTPAVQTPVQTPAQGNEMSAPVQQLERPAERPAASVEQPQTNTAASSGTNAEDREKQSMKMAADAQKNRLRTELAKSIDDYTKYKTAGDVVNTMLKATDIGLFQIRLENFESSRLYLDEALQLARQLKLEEDEATIIGHMGLLEEARGARQQAVQLIEECIGKLQALNSPGLQRWQDELKRIQSR